MKAFDIICRLDRRGTRLAGLGALTGLMACLLLTGCDEAPPPVVEQVRAVKTIIITESASGTLRMLPGIVEATDSSSLSFEVSGNVQQLHVDVGDRVRKGQVLAVLDKQYHQLGAQAAQSSLQRAQASLTEVSVEFERQKTLFENGWIAQAALDQVTAEYETALAGLEYEQSLLGLAQRDLEKTVLHAPFDGVISARPVEPFAEVNRGQTVFDIYVEESMEVVLNIPETMIREIELGTVIDATFPSLPDKTFQAVISEIGTVAEATNAFPVRAVIAEDRSDIRPGMTAEVALLVGQEQQAEAFLIPLAAFAGSSEESAGFIYLVDEATSTVRKTDVEVRGASGNSVAIKGVMPGDVLVVAGVSFLTDGQKVRVLAR